MRFLSAGNSAGSVPVQTEVALLLLRRQLAHERRPLVVESVDRYGLIVRAAGAYPFRHFGSGRDRHHLDFNDIC